mgnify:CR=1 FL=1
MNKTLWSIMPGIYRRRAIWVVATIFLRALLNFVGIATLVPLLIVILNRDAITSNDYLAEIYNKLNPSSYTNFIFPLALYPFEREGISTISISLNDP